MMQIVYGQPKELLAEKLLSFLEAEMLISEFDSLQGALELWQKGLPTVMSI